MIEAISGAIIPIVILVIVIYGVYKKVNIYDVFIDGAKESIDITFNLFPSMLAMVFGVNIFLKSGIIDFLFTKLNLLNFPNQIFPMMIMRSISGSSSLAILTNIFENCGADSFAGIFASILQGATDTTFYIITIYFGIVGIKRTKYALKAGILTDIVSIIVSFLIVKIFFNF